MPRVLVPAVLLSTLLGAAPSFADPCRVEVGAGTPEVWTRAASEVDAARRASGDCARVRLDFEDDVALVTYTTDDGRSARRVVGRPDELGPTLDALHVTLPEVEPPARIEPSLPAPALRTREQTASAVAPPPPAPADSSTVLALEAGSRGGADHLVSPVVSGSASLSFSRWELGVTAALDLQYFDVASSPVRAPSSAVVAGVMLGRREPLGAVSVLAGGRLLLAALNDEREVDSGDRGRAEARFASYVGVVFPRREKTRFRAELGVDVVPHDVGGSSGSAEEPTTPWWAVTTLVGVEIGEP